MSVEQYMPESISGSHFPVQSSLIQIFKEQSKASPGSVAVISGTQRITYGELDKSSDILALEIISRGFKPGMLGGICMHRSVEMIVSILAILKAGGGYVPVDPTYPRNRMEKIVADADLRFVLAEEGKVLLPFGDGTEIIYFSYTRQTDSEAEINFPEIPRDSESTAYVMFTSGTTGNPKGVVVPDRAVIRLVRDTNYLSILKTDVFSHFSNVSFDAATFEIWGALLNGAGFVIIENEIILSPTSFAKSLQENHVSIMFITTALFNFHVSQNPAIFRGMKYVLFGGEVADPSAVMMVIKGGAPEHLYNVYGPTENTTFSTYYRANGFTAEMSRLPIGKAISNTETFILNENLELVPDGEKGELYLAGTGLAKGYLNSPGLTAEKFIEAPFSKGKMLYKTGDIVARRSDNDIDFFGRVDDQVKIRGFRIEPAEIKFALNEIPEVRDCAIVIKEDRQRGRFLVAFYTLNKGAELGVRDIYHIMREKLPDYMIPAVFTRIDEIPLTPNGKIDTAALQSVDIRHTFSETAPHYEYLPEEIKMIEIWSEILEIESPGVADDFFDLGGNSLLAVQILIQIQQVFGVEMPIRSLYESPTISGLCKRVNELIKKGGQGIEDKPVLVSIRATGKNTPLFFIPPFYNAHSYFETSRCLREEQPCYSFEPNYTDEEKINRMTIEGISKRYLNLLLEKKPEGPFYLCGWSLGSVIALETARLLRQKTDSKIFLILLDPSPLYKEYGYHRIRSKVLRFPFYILLRLEGFINFRHRTKMGFLSTSKWILSSIRRFADSALKVGGKESGKAISFADKIESGEMNDRGDQSLKPHLNAYADYTPGKVRADAMIIWARDAYRTPFLRLWESSLMARFFGFQAFIDGKTEQCSVDGNHESMLEKPYVEALAREIENYIKKNSA